MAVGGKLAGRPLSSTVSVPTSVLAELAVRLAMLAVRLAVPLAVPLIADPWPAAATFALRSAWLATAAAEPNRIASGTAAPIWSAASSYSVQPSTSAPHLAGVLAAASAIAAPIASLSPASTALARPGQATGVTSEPPPNSAMSLRWYSLSVVATVAQMATERAAAAAGLIAGTVPTTGISGSNRDRSTSSACTDPVLHAMMI